MSGLGEYWGSAAAEAGSVELVGAAPDAHEAGIAQRNHSTLRLDPAACAEREGLVTRRVVTRTDGEEDIGLGTATGGVGPVRGLQR